MSPYGSGGPFASASPGRARSSWQILPKFAARTPILFGSPENLGEPTTGFRDLSDRFGQARGDAERAGRDPRRKDERSSEPLEERAPRVAHHRMVGRLPFHPAPDRPSVWRRRWLVSPRAPRLIFLLHSTGPRRHRCQSPRQGARSERRYRPSSSSGLAGSVLSRHARSSRSRAATSLHRKTPRHTSFRLETLFSSFFRLVARFFPASRASGSEFMAVASAPAGTPWLVFGPADHRSAARTCGREGELGCACRVQLRGPVSHRRRLKQRLRESNLHLVSSR